jgi:GNAT superfamily N-acetyltransferase
MARVSSGLDMYHMVHSSTTSGGTLTCAGRTLPVDDLVVATDAPGGGIGALLLRHLEGRAAELRCTRVDMDSRVHRHEAHRFYLRSGFDIVAHHFLRSVNPAMPR